MKQRKLTKLARVRRGPVPVNLGTEFSTEQLVGIDTGRLESSPEAPDGQECVPEFAVQPQSTGLLGR